MINVIGLTGQTGAGKSAVCRHLTAKNIPCIDCDKVAREVVEPGQPALGALVEVFGQGILQPDGALDRKALGALVFSDKAALERLNETIFPFILDAIREKIAAMESQGVKRVVLDAPTLFESGCDALCTRTVAVIADEDIRRERIMARDNLSADAAQKRMDSQLSEDFFKTRCDAVIANNGDVAALKKTVEGVFFKTRKRLWWLTVIPAVILLIIGVVWLFPKAQDEFEHASYPRTYAELIEPTAQKYGVDPALVYAVVRTESGFEADAVSNIGARGLMQITKPTFEWAQWKRGTEEEHSFDDLFDPAVNIDYGTYLLSVFLEEFGSVENALAAYHAGWGVTKEWLKDPQYAPEGTLVNTPYKDTNWYIQTVCDTHCKYQTLYFKGDENHE